MKKKIYRALGLMSGTSMDGVDASIVCSSDGINYITSSKEKVVKLLKCSACKNEYFCGIDCQKKGWKVHRKVCGKVGF